jgi:hypothetical protein
MHRVDKESEPRDARTHRLNLSALFMERQAKAGEMVHDPPFPLPQKAAVVGEEREIIHIAQVRRTA